MRQATTSHGQPLFVSLEFDQASLQAQHERILATAEQVMPWRQLQALVEPACVSTNLSTNKRCGTRDLLRVYLLQRWFRLGDEAVEVAIQDSRPMQDFIGIDLDNERVPDPGALSTFRLRLDEQQITRRLSEDVDARLAACGLMLRDGAMIDATVIPLPTRAANSEPSPRRQETRTEVLPPPPERSAEALRPNAEIEPVVTFSLIERASKRLFDLASVVVILVLFWWAIIAVALAVRFTTGSPVIFSHKRVGRNGREFKCYKFRSMVPDADFVLANLLAIDAEAREQWNRDFKLKKDPRVTRVGRFIRMTSLDEFPQLWNVLMNEMSIVGPRPVVQKELNLYYTGTAREHYVSVKPGLTGPWQVSGRSDMEYAERVELDRSYVRSWSLWSDFIIVMRTVGVMFGRKGAY